MRYGKVIQGRTIILRDIEERDAEVTFRMRSDPQKSRYIHGATGTVEDQRAFIRKQKDRPGDYLFVIENLEGNPIGMKGVYDWDEEAGTVETGRFMCFGTPIQSIEALYLSFDFAFDVLGVKRIVMSVLEENSNMRGMQERFGARVTHVEFNDEFGCNSIYSELTKDIYAETRPKAAALVKRFAIKRHSGGSD